MDSFALCSGSLPVSTIAESCPGHIEGGHTEHFSSGLGDAPEENIKERVFS